MEESMLYPASDPNQFSGISPGQNGLIIRYERTKKITRWLLILFLIFGASYVILTARSEKLPASSLSESILGSRMAVNGKMIVLSSIRQDKQEILISYDSGKLFYRLREGWKIQDSSILIAIAQDGSTVLALEKNGLLHYKTANENYFTEQQVTLPVKDSMVTGLSLIPGTDSVYIFGRFPGIIALSWRNPGRFFLYHTPGVKQTISLAVSPDRNIACILEDLGSRNRRLYYGKSIASLQALESGYIDSGSRQTIDTTVKAIDDTVSAVIDTTAFHKEPSNSIRQKVDQKKPNSNYQQQVDQKNPPSNVSQQADQKNPPSNAGQQADQKNPPSNAGQQADQKNPANNARQQQVQRPADSNYLKK
jgi:hypothetical protein